LKTKATKKVFYTGIRLVYLQKVYLVENKAGLYPGDLVYVKQVGFLGAGFLHKVKI